MAEVIAWLRGIPSSTVLAESSEQNFDGENPHLRAATGEELRFRELKTERGLHAVGFRHDLPDMEGRLWRTEGVLRYASSQAEQDVLRIRTQCIATVAGARLEIPKKPFLIKSLLNGGWGGDDGLIAVSDQPTWLSEAQDDLAIARAVTVGAASKSLPAIYVSASAKGAWLLSEADIESLAYELGGIAHVVVEPSRAFSYDLRDLTKGRNVYAGTVGIVVPGQGIVRRYHLGMQAYDSKELRAIIRVAAINLRSQMPATGWDWTDLQEQALRTQRERDKNRLTSAEKEQLYQDEIDNLQDKIRQLELQLCMLPKEALNDSYNEFSNENFVRLIGPEIYSGEVFDRVRLAARIALNNADRIGLDTRSTSIMQRISNKLPASPALDELLQDLSRATKDPKRLASELTALLTRHGYVEKSDNKHIRLEAVAGYEGLEAITVPKTPSDSRGLKNLRNQIQRTLGLSKLTD
ncbi:hypothetical protein [Rhizobium sp. NRK18]|uniref:hypothetical protein n=1 Tax=Rhizobium sp. NRK18 TaxID=2964667 RepID=UPI0021C4A878|nr:hypothetical protein [Rhizobium sp. NRK18]MCQ2004959.1 hypothetical protein [Rhizobium sp. NRK18]